MNKEKIEKLKYMVIDVDGTMTDGGIYYDENGNEMKKFNTRDAAGFFAAKTVGIQIVVLTGRECKATERRMKELKVEYLFQNVKNKNTFLKSFMSEKGIQREEIGYIGDDLNDLSPMELVGFKACPADACKEIKEKVDYIAACKGGSGAIRDVFEYVLESRIQWEKAIKSIYSIDS